MCEVSNLKSKGRARAIREGSMGVKGSHLWNSLPMSIRNYRGYGTSLNGFKGVLGRYPWLVPDKP